MESKRTQSLCVALLFVLAASVAAFAAEARTTAPASTTKTGRASNPAAPASKNQQPSKVTVVHRQPRVDVPARMLTDGDKPLPAGTYDITLVNLEYSDGTKESAFQFRQPGGDDVVATLGGVMAGVMTQKAARSMVGGPLRRGGKRTPEPKAGTESSDTAEASEAGAQKKDDEAKPKREPIMATVMGNSVRVSFWEKTEQGTFRVLHADGRIQPGS